MKQNRKRILLAVDGSLQAMDAVRYVGAFLPLTRTDVVLFHVHARAPEAFLDLKRDPEYRSDGLPMSDWSLLVHKNMDEFMDDAERVLVDTGFPSERIRRKIQQHRVGIARDILDESRQGYDAVVVGRVGLGSVQEETLGSVALKLAGQRQSVPIVLVSGKPETRKVLISFDGSEGAKRAVDLVCSLLFREDREITLCHVVRSLGMHLESDRVFLPEHEKLWMDVSRKEIEPLLEEAERKLIEAGFHPGCVYTEILENLTSRAAGIKNAASNGGFGSVVLGRRGLSEVEEFPMGRVPMKMLQLGGRMAVWIV
jgi:nucleotide-binding universal stress UspA family protein